MASISASGLPSGRIFKTASQVRQEGPGAIGRSNVGIGVTFASGRSRLSGRRANMQTEAEALVLEMKPAALSACGDVRWPDRRVRARSDWWCRSARPYAARQSRNRSSSGAPINTRSGMLCTVVKILPPIGSGRCDPRRPPGASPPPAARRSPRSPSALTIRRRAARRSHRPFGRQHEGMVAPPLGRRAANVCLR